MAAPGAEPLPRQALAELSHEPYHPCGQRARFAVVAAAPSMATGFLSDPQRHPDACFFRLSQNLCLRAGWTYVDATGFCCGAIKIGGRRVGPGELQAVLMAPSSSARQGPWGR